MSIFLPLYDTSTHIRWLWNFRTLFYVRRWYNPTIGLIIWMHESFFLTSHKMSFSPKIVYIYIYIDTQHTHIEVVSCEIIMKSCKSREITITRIFLGNYFMLLGLNFRYGNQISDIMMPWSSISVGQGTLKWALCVAFYLGKLLGHYPLCHRIDP